MNFRILPNMQEIEMEINEDMTIQQISEMVYKIKPIVCNKTDILNNIKNINNKYEVIYKGKRLNKELTAYSYEMINDNNPKLILFVPGRPIYMKYNYLEIY